MTFDDYLKDAFAEDYHGTSDDMPDAFDRWCSYLDYDDWCAHAERYAKAEVAAVIAEAQRLAANPTE